MDSRASTPSFDSLARLNRKQLDRIMSTGTAPSIADLLGWEFRGWNVKRRTRLLGRRKFKKGFFGDPAKPEAWGYNVKVRQDGLPAPWRAVPSDERPTRDFFFGLMPAEDASKPRYPNSLVVDYHRWGEYFFLNPAGYTVDYLVYPDPDNPNLILGKSYLEIAFLRLPLGHLVLERHNESRYPRTSHFLSARQLRTVRAFAEIFIEGSDEVITPEEITWNIDRNLERIDSNRTRSLKLILFIVEYILPRRSLWPFRRAFSKMRPAARKRFVQKRLQDPRNRGILRDLAKIRTLFSVGYYGDPRVHASIQFVRVPDRARFQSGKLRRLEPQPVEITDPPGERIDCEVCIIGSGAGGAVAAANLAVAGKDVVLLEEGPYLRPEEMTHDEGVATARLYKEGGLQSTVDIDMVILQGKCLGGSTPMNNAICFPLAPDSLSVDVLDDWERLGARIDRPALASSFKRVRQAIGVAPLLDLQDPEVPRIDGQNARVLLEGWERVRQRHPERSAWGSGLFHKNKNRCLGCGYCNFGCPYGRKMSMLETYVPLAARHGARVIVDCHAVKIERRGARATAVRCERRDGRALTVQAGAVVVSCGAIGSSVLLLKSGLKRNVGKRFSFNAATPVFARFPQRIDAFDGVQMAAYLDSGEFILESHFDPPMTFAASLPGWFAPHFDRMRAYAHLTSAGVLIGTEPTARVVRCSLTRQLLGPIDYTMSRSDLAKLKRGMAQAAEIYFEAGAEAFYPATFADVELTPGSGPPDHDEILRRLDRHITRPDDLTLSSAHPQGGNAMSDDERVGVVDSGFRVHGCENLFVCDASVFPTSVRVNPQLAIMAMADYFARLGVD